MKGRDNKSTVITISSMDNLKEKIDEIGGSFPVIVYIDSSVAQIDTMTSLKSVLEAYFSIRPYANVTMSCGEEVIEEWNDTDEKYYQILQTIIVDFHCEGDFGKNVYKSDLLEWLHSFKEFKQMVNNKVNI